jgi:hypothetical protein
MQLNDFDQIRLQQGAEYVHTLDPHATAEFLVEVAGTIGGSPTILGQLTEYQRRLTLGMVRAAGGERSPVRQLRSLPGGGQ